MCQQTLETFIVPLARGAGTTEMEYDDQAEKDQCREEKLPKDDLHVMTTLLIKVTHVFGRTTCRIPSPPLEGGGTLKTWQRLTHFNSWTRQLPDNIARDFSYVCILYISFLP